jgi:hypothetical protein
MPHEPKRIQRSCVKGWHTPDNTVIVDRTSTWGNPWKIHDPKGRSDWWVARKGCKDGRAFSTKAESYWHARRPKT